MNSFSKISRPAINNIGVCWKQPQKDSQFKHLGLWEVKPRPPPRAIGPPKTPEYNIDYSVSQLPPSDDYLYLDVDYPEAFSA